MVNYMLSTPGSGAPYMYDYQNVAAAEISPGTVHSQNTGLVWYYRRYLLQKAMSVFKWTLPENWSKAYFLYVLYCWGNIAIINTDKFGVIPQGGCLTGYNVFYEPTHIQITNPLISKELMPRIGVDCTLIKLQPDYGGIMDLINDYAELMAIASETISMNLMNSKLSYVFTAANKTAAESFKKLYDQICAGNPAAVVDKNLMNNDGSPAWTLFMQNVGQNYITDRVLSDVRKIEAMFDTHIGIPNANTDKRERLVTDEVNANNVETYSKCALWLEELQEGCRKANDMFGIEMAVDWRVPPDYKQEVSDNESDNDSSGVV